ncbi:putative F-box protein At5g62060 [Papaver somniferum]|uniref:putative F-box protein At5g62060 n=1 Tax=Papaver somniferum TaxID=3469 RepID=UPI000E6FF3E5|nr:putative F-box protein At5g62060 [Papaver somniferum]
MEKKVKFTSAFYDDIHEDILLQILYKLPAISLIRFSCVSKLWFYLINNHQQQFNKYDMVESQKKPLLMFNGLTCEHKSEVCYGENCYFSLEICNPSRLEKLIILSRFNIGEDDLMVEETLFGYDILRDEYRVMCIIQNKDECEYYILTLGSTKPSPWRRINNPWPKRHPLSYFPFTRRRVPPISCNGTLFYHMVKDEAEEEKYKRLTLVSFNLNDEQFQMIKLPGDEEFVSSYNNGDFSLLEYKGCFCYSSMEKFDTYCGKIVLHILKGDTIKHAWVKETIKFNLPRELDSPAPTSSTSILIISIQVILHWRFNSKGNCHVTIQLYNVHSKELMEVKVPEKDFNLCFDYYIFIT